MSPGINDGQKNTGTLPKSNRRNDRNRERSAANQQISNRVANHGHLQHSNNLLQLDWQPVNERETVRATKNSNTRSDSSIASTSYHDTSDFALPGIRQYNYTRSDSIPWQKMDPPTDSRSQSPRHSTVSKPTNVDRMPDRSQVESRLNQLREYIRTTSTMMDSLSLSNDPKVRAQNEKLSRMVGDLCDSEQKLTKLLESYNSQGLSDEIGNHFDLRSNQLIQFSNLMDILNLQEHCLSSITNFRNGENGRDDEEDGDTNREMQLRKKMEESQRKLAQLQEHQANLVGMQLLVRERLNEARQAQQALLQQENQMSTNSFTWDNCNELPAPTQANVEQLESETAQLRGKLVQLQNKKKHMDHLVAELQAVELSDKRNCSSEMSRSSYKDKAAELDAMKAQLAHLKTLMDEATRVRECLDSTSEPETEMENIGPSIEETETKEFAGIEIPEISNYIDNHSYNEELHHVKSRLPIDRPTVEDVQAVTRELKEQSAMIQATRAELQRLKQPLLSMYQSTPAPVGPVATPPLSIVGSTISNEKKQTNNFNEEIQQIQLKKRQFEDLMRKQDQGNASSINRDGIGSDYNSQRGSTSQLSHNGTPANVWPPSAVTGSADQSIDGTPLSENLLDIGPQAAMENGFNTNWWGFSLPSMGQPPQNSIDYYKHLLIGSQAQQLQMMGTTIQQCCQLLWAQQRELQSMRAAINQMQLQLRQNQNQMPIGTTTVDNQEQYSNLSRNPHSLGSTLDAALPPSSSLPNLVSLPTPSPTFSHTPVITTAATQQQQQQQQLNNQVPPGNRANNYWDNFRSYSRQNLLSGNVKTVADTALCPATNSTSASNTASGGINSSLVRDKRNREQSTENLPLPSLSGIESQYSSNLQLQSNLQLHERENMAGRSNILMSDTFQQDNLWEEGNVSFRLPSATNDDLFLRNLSPELKEVLTSLISANRSRLDYLIVILKEIKTVSEDNRLRNLLWQSLQALQDAEPQNSVLNEVADQTASESCLSSDEETDLRAMLGLDNHLLIGATCNNYQSLGPSNNVLENSSTNEARAQCSMSSVKVGNNEDLAEVDQSRSESSRNPQSLADTTDSDEGQDEAAAHPLSVQMIPVVEDELENSITKAEDERVDDIVLDKIPTRLQHH